MGQETNLASVLIVFMIHKFCTYEIIIWCSSVTNFNFVCKWNIYNLALPEAVIWTKEYLKYIQFNDSVIQISTLV